MLSVLRISKGNLLAECHHPYVNEFIKILAVSLVTVLDDVIEQAEAYAQDSSSQRWGFSTLICAGFIYLYMKDGVMRV